MTWWQIALIILAGWVIAAMLAAVIFGWIVQPGEDDDGDDAGPV